MYYILDSNDNQLSVEKVSEIFLGCPGIFILGDGKLEIQTKKGLQAVKQAIKEHHLNIVTMIKRI